MEKRVQKFNIKAERKSAVTPSEVNINFHPSSQHINNNEKACTQSHIELFKEFLFSDYEYLMIIEDDAKFRKDWIEEINKKLSIINQEDPNWHALFLYSTEGIKHYSLANAGIPMDEEDKKLCGVWRKIQEHYATLSIIYSKKGIEEFFSMFSDQNGGYHKIDWMTWNLQYKGHCYGIFPWLMCIDGTESSLLGKDASDADYRKAMKLLKEVDYSYDNYE